MSKRKILLLLAIAAAIVAFFALDLGRFLDLAFFKEQQAAIDGYRQTHPLLTAGLFFIIYVAVTGLSLPGAAVMTLVGGAIFGLFWGTVIISFASSIGATLAFLASRLLFRDSVQQRFGDKLRAMNEGIAKDGYRLIVNCGQHGGQIVFHLHMHLLGGQPLGRMLAK